MMIRELARRGNESGDDILKFILWKNVCGAAVSVHRSVTEPHCTVAFIFTVKGVHRGLCGFSR